MNFNKNFCPIPFVSLIFHPNGNFSFCRELGLDNFSKEHNPKEWPRFWHSKTMQQIRRDFLDGNPPLLCKKNIEEKKCNQSQMLKELLSYQHFVLTPPPPIIIAPGFSSQCNLKCVMCEIPNRINSPLYTTDLRKQLSVELLPFIKQVDLVFGEPFIQNETFCLCDDLKTANPNTQWRITTNANWQWSEKIEHFLSSININSISMSLDSLSNECYKKIRNKDIHLVLENIHRFKNLQQSKKFKLFITPTIGQINCHEVPLLISQCKKWNILIHLQFIYRPYSMSMLALPDDEKINILNYYLKELSENELIFAHPIVYPLISTLEQNIKKKYAFLFKLNYLSK